MSLCTGYIVIYIIHNSHPTPICSNYKSVFERLSIFIILSSHSGNYTTAMRIAKMKDSTLYLTPSSYTRNSFEIYEERLQSTNERQDTRTTTKYSITYNHMSKTIQSIYHKCYKNKVTIIFLFDKSDTKLSLTLQRIYINTKRSSIDDTLYNIAERISIDIHRDF